MIEEITAVTLHAMVPLALTAIGEVFNEKAGIVNIGLEGILLLSSFMAVLGAEAFKSWVVGILVALLTGALIGLLHGIVSVYGKGDQTVSGTGITLFALGFVAYGIWVAWGTPGHHMASPDVVVPRLPTPIGPLSWMVFVTIIIAFLVHFLLHKTVIGLRVKAAGENPEAADVAGVRVEQVRLLACVFGAALAGLAGAFMSLDQMAMTTKELPAGRGFIALACVAFSGLEPLLALGAATVFGFFDALGMWINIIPYFKPWLRYGAYEFVHMIPYLVTLAAVTIAVGKRRFPKASGVPYRKE